MQFKYRVSTQTKKIARCEHRTVKSETKYVSQREERERGKESGRGEQIGVWGR